MFEQENQIKYSGNGVVCSLINFNGSTPKKRATPVDAVSRLTFTISGRPYVSS